MVWSVVVRSVGSLFLFCFINYDFFRFLRLGPLHPDTCTGILQTFLV